MGRWVLKDDEPTFMGYPCPTHGDGSGGGTGQKGDKGDPGKDGEDGLPGADGKDGKDGLPGADGKDGADAGDSPHDHDEYALVEHDHMTDMLNPELVFVRQGQGHGHEDIPESTGTVTFIDRKNQYLGFMGPDRGAHEFHGVSSDFGGLVIETAHPGFLETNEYHPISLVAVSGVHLYGGNDQTYVHSDLTVDGTINGTLAFTLAEETDAVAVLDRAANGHDGVATTDVKALGINEVVTALMLKVKQQSEQIAALTANIEALNA